MHLPSIRHIAVVNLKTRDDRMEYVQQELTRVGLNERAKVHRFERSPKGGRFGCFTSHVSVIREYYEDPSVRHVLILEDDVKFMPGYESVLADCERFLVNEQEPWDALVLGCNIFFVAQRSATVKAICNAKFSQTHAYVLSRQGMRTVLDNYEGHEMELLDHFYDKTLARTFVHLHSYKVIQDTDFDTDNTWSDGLACSNASFRHWYQNRFVTEFFFPLLSKINVLMFWVLPFRLRTVMFRYDAKGEPKPQMAIQLNGSTTVRLYNMYCPFVPGGILFYLVGFLLTFAYILCKPHGNRRMALLREFLKLSKTVELDFNTNKNKLKTHPEPK